MDDKSLLDLLLTSSKYRSVIKSDPVFYKHLLLELVLKKLLKIISNVDENNVKYAAFYQLVKTQVLTNPEQALATAELIPTISPNPSGAWKNKAMYEIANELISTNPEKALAAANRIQINIRSQYEGCGARLRCEVMYQIFKEQLPTNPAQALATARLLPDSGDTYNGKFRIQAMQEIFNALDSESLDELLNASGISPSKWFLNELLPSNLNAHIQLAVVKELALTALEESLSIIDKSPALQKNVREQIIAFCEVAKAQAAINMDQANRLFQQALETANHIEDERTWDEYDLVQCRDHRDEYRRSTFAANNIEDERDCMMKSKLLKSAVLCDIAQALCEAAHAQASTNMDQANQLVQQALEIAASEYITSDETVLIVKALSNIANAQASTNLEQANQFFQQALEVADDIEDPLSKSKALCVISEARAFSSMEEANQLLSNAIGIAFGLENKMSRFKALCEVAKAQAATNMEPAIQFFQEALETAKSIDLMESAQNWERNGRTSISTAKALCEIARREASINPERANEFFSQLLSIANSHTSGVVQTVIFGIIARAMVGS